MVEQYALNPHPPKCELLPWATVVTTSLSLSLNHRPPHPTRFHLLVHKHQQQLSLLWFPSLEIHFLGVQGGQVVIRFGRWSCFDSWVWYEKASGIFSCSLLFRMVKNLCRRNSTYRCPSQWPSPSKMPGR